MIGSYFYRMQQFRALWKYWKENYALSKERRKALSAFLTGLAAVALFLLGFLELPCPKIEVFLKSSAAFWIEVAAFLWATLYLLAWLPFKRHRDEDDAHATEMGALEAQIAAYKERDRPKLKISFSKTISGCSATNHNGQRYFRLLILLDCHQAVSGCSGVLTCVERESDGMILMNHESIPLPFVPSHEPDSTNKTLVPSRPYYLDVLVVNEHAQQLQNPGPGGKVYFLKDNSNHLVFSKPDAYLLTVNLAGAGIPTQICQVRFEWTGDHNTVLYSMV